MSGAAAQTSTPHGDSTRRLAEFASGLRFDDIPREVVGTARACVLDALGCCLYGASLPWTRIVRDMVLEQGGAPQAAIMGTRDRTSVSQAVLVNSTAGHAFELDDTHNRGSMHAGSVNIPVALAISDWLGNVSGRDFITAVVAGYEAGLRVGIAADGNIFKRGFHSAAVCGVFAAAAVASRMLGLGGAQTAHAFGTAGSMAGGLMAAQEGAMVKRVHAGRAAQAGVYAALLARRGFTGIENVLEIPFGGFYHAMSERYVPDFVTAGLGEKWETLLVGFKPYATAGAIHASLAALDGIMGENELGANNIERIDVRCTTYCCKHVAWRYEPRGVAAAQLNMFYALSAMAIDRAAMIEQFDEQRLADPRLLAFMPRIHVEPDPAFDALGHAFRYALRMMVACRDGRSFERQSLHRPGTPDNPLSASRIEAKFRLLAGRVLPGGAVDEIVTIVSRLERLDDVKQLSALLVPAR